MIDFTDRINELTDYAKNKLGLDARDEFYVKNRLAEIFLSGAEGAELEDAIYGELSLLPSAVDAVFQSKLKSEGSRAATDWFYTYCVNNMYVKKAVLDKNPRFDTDGGLVVTINKAKPEFRDPKKAKAGNSVDGGFAKCVICRENEGFGARNKRNLRTVSITLGSQPWFWQYSPYGYFNEHGIAVNCEHIPMHVDKSTFYKLLDFVDLFPHYFIGCNAPLPRIGGSVLAHDHYQGGGEVLPLHRAKIRKYVKDAEYPSAKIGILEWPGTVIRIMSADREQICGVSEKIRRAWEGYSVPGLGLIAEDKDGVHNAISPTVIKTAAGYEMNIILRSNVTSEKYPDGVFHAHPEFHSIKKESIGLIEAQGLFILPGRLEEELAEIERLIAENLDLPPDYDRFKLVYDETKALISSGSFADVGAAMRAELGSICYRILENTAVFADDGRFGEFLIKAGCEL